MPDLEPLVDRALAWFSDPVAAWDGDPLILPASATLFCGESTGPASSPDAERPEAVAGAV
jgi:hypothetical protein